ncbi:MAG TPA: hypothetical protein VGR22_06150 [Thermomicrobiales bacterium]|nr:hypothetical protein [Thermomicrobiales bacterium]
MQTLAIITLLTLAALAVVPLTIGYYLWLDRAILPRVLKLPTRIARTILALLIALPWVVAALTVWLLRG